jgi:uncharacterized integral membrane protein (TIGR00697 family)
MVNNESIYTGLCVLFSVLIVAGNLIYQKFVCLPIFPFHVFELSVGAILYPLTFLLTDLITEFYGKEKANFCVKLGICMNILIACIVIGMDSLDATTWSKIDNVTFHKVFEFYGVAFVGSILACYISQFVDITLYLWIRKITKGKWLWARNNGSTAISLFVDTSIVVSFMAIFHVLPIDRMGPLIINSYLFKVFFSVCSTPLFYICVEIIRNLQQNKKSQSLILSDISTIK